MKKFFIYFSYVLFLILVFLGSLKYFLPTGVNFTEVLIDALVEDGYFIFLIMSFIWVLSAFFIDLKLENTKLTKSKKELYLGAFQILFAVIYYSIANFSQPYLSQINHKVVCSYTDKQDIECDGYLYQFAKELKIGKPMKCTLEIGNI